MLKRTFFFKVTKLSLTCSMYSFHLPWKLSFKQKVVNWSSTISWRIFEDQWDLLTALVPGIFDDFASFPLITKFKIQTRRNSAPWLWNRYKSQKLRFASRCWQSIAPSESLRLHATCWKWVINPTPSKVIYCISKKDPFRTKANYTWIYRVSMQT